jgi:hypothetical protein
MSTLDTLDWFEDELRSLPVDTRMNLLIDAIKHNQHAFNIEEGEALNATFEMVRLVGLMSRNLTRAGRFHLANVLRDLADQAEHLPPRNNQEVI